MKREEKLVWKPTRLLWRPLSKEVLEVLEVLEVQHLLSRKRQSDAWRKVKQKGQQRKKLKIPVYQMLEFQIE
jgi:hypothetical protein